MTSNEKLFYEICDYNGLHYVQHPTLNHIMWVRQPYVHPHYSILFYNKHDDSLHIANTARLAFSLDSYRIIYSDTLYEYNDESFKFVLKTYNELIHEIKQLQLKQKLDRINDDF